MAGLHISEGIISPPASLLEVDEVSSHMSYYGPRANSVKQSSHQSLISCVMQARCFSLTDRNRRDVDLASLTSSVLEYEFENGRRYHGYKAGSYPLPNDEVWFFVTTLGLQHGSYKNHDH